MATPGCACSGRWGGNHNPATRERVLHIVAFRGDAVALPLLQQKKNGPAVVSATEKIRSLQPIA
jgi:hypothetical protein